MTGRLAVLSLGFTRGLWEGDSSEDVVRLRGYAAFLRRYLVLVNSYRRHRLRPLRLGPGFDAVPTDAGGPVGSALRMLRWGSAALRRERFDVVQGQDPFLTGLVAVLLGRLHGVPSNVCVYGPNVFDPAWARATRHAWLLAPVGRWVLRRADGVQVDGRLTAARLVAAGIPAERVRVKPMVPGNFADLLAVPRAPRPVGAPVRILFIGRLEAQKNLPLLARAFQLARARSPVPLELEIVGAGRQERMLRDLLVAEIASGVVHWSGPQPRERIPAVFGRADLFLLVSDFEGFPRVLMEAAAAGVPAVSTAVSGADEAIEDGVTGRIVPIGDADALASAVVHLATDAERRLAFGAAARARIEARFAGWRNDEAQVEIWRAMGRCARESGGT